MVDTLLHAPTQVTWTNMSSQQACSTSTQILYLKYTIHTTRSSQQSSPISLIIRLLLLLLLLCQPLQHFGGQHFRWHNVCMSTSMPNQQDK